MVPLSGPGAGLIVSLLNCVSLTSGCSSVFDLLRSPAGLSNGFFH
jgi:hypothetical protein